MTRKYIDETGAYIELLDQGYGLYEITMIYVPANSRGRGVGQRLLSRLLDDADRVGVILQLVPCGTNLSTQQLEVWYLRLGFCWQSNGVMKRYPTWRCHEDLSLVGYENERAESCSA